MIGTTGKERWKLRIPYIVPKFHERWSTNGENQDSHFYPPSENSAFFVIAGLRIRRTQPNFGVNHGNKLL